MDIKLYLLVCLGLTIAIDAKKTSIPPVVSAPFIMTVELKFSDETVTDFIVESYFATALNRLDTTKNCNISLFDILSVIPFKGQTTDDLSTALEKLNITLEGDDINQFIQGLNYTELQQLGFSLAKVYKNIVKTYFTNSTDKLLQCLNILGIAPEFTTAYAFGTEEDMFLALQKGNYSINNIQQITEIISAAPSNQNVLKLLGIKRFDSPYIQQLVNENLTRFLDEKGLQEDNLREFLDTFSLTVSNYKSIKSFKTFYRSSTETESLAVATSPSEIITNDLSVIQSYFNLEKYTSLKIKSLQNSEMKYLVSSRQLQSNHDDFITIQVDTNIPNYISKTENYQGLLLTNCTYITYDGDNLISQNANVKMVETKLSISKEIDTLYKKSSPLICDDALYGLAATNDINTIGFSMVGNHEDVPNDDITDVYQLFVSFVNFFDLCKVLNCSSQVSLQQFDQHVNQGADQQIGQGDQVVDENIGHDNNDNDQQQSENTDQQTDEAIGQSTEQNIDPTTEQTAQENNEDTDEDADQYVTQSADQDIFQLVDQSTDKDINQYVEEDSTDQTVKYTHVEEHTEHNFDQYTEQDVDNGQQIEQNIGQHNDEYYQDSESHIQGDAGEFTYQNTDENVECISL